MKYEMELKMKHSWVALFLCIFISFLPALFGSLFEPGAWYAGLKKPLLNPPGWVFGPVWSALYIMMGLSCWLLWRCRHSSRVGMPMVVFSAQLVLNGLWPYIFFGLKRPGLAFVEIIILWFAIGATVVLFYSKRKSAGLLLCPYLVWVTFAAYLNFSIWRLNA